MKKMVLLVALIINVASFSQERDKGVVELTPVIGYVSSNYYGDAGSGNKSINTLGFGLDLDYFFNDRWSLRSGILSQKLGTQFTGVKDELNYITIPVNANWHFGSTRKWNLNFGPSIGFLTAAKENGSDIKALVNTTQLALNIGIGYKIEVSEKFSILLDYQSQTGLSDITKTSGTDLRNATGTFNIGGVIVL